jgi:hypothetical protein
MRTDPRLQDRRHLHDFRELASAGNTEADNLQFIPVLRKIRVRGPVGRPRTRPDAVAGDKAYSSRGNRGHLRSLGIKAVIPEKRDRAARGTGPPAGRTRAPRVVGPSAMTPISTRSGTPSSG